MSERLVYAVPGPWAAQAACQGATELMAVPIGAGHNRAQLAAMERGRQACHECPVKAECLAWALTDPDPAEWMIAGGYTPLERQRIRRGDPNVIRTVGGHRRAAS